MMSRILCTISIPLVCSIPTVYLFPSRFAIPSPSSSPHCPISFHFILFLVLFCPSLGSFHFLSFLFFPILPIKSSLQLSSPCPFRLFPFFVFFSACTDEFQFKSITWNPSIRKSFFNFVLPLYTLDYFYNDGKRYSAIRIAVHRLFIQSTSNVTWHYSFSYVSKVLAIFITIFWQQLSGQLRKMSPSASHKKCKSEWRRRVLD